MDPKLVTPRCQCIVDLLSKVQRPFLFQVTVWGEPPHAYTRKYQVAAPDEASAAHCGLEQFCKEAAHPVLQLMTGLKFTKAKLQ